jgi:hypothetical protein
VSNRKNGGSKIIEQWLRYCGTFGTLKGENYGNKLDVGINFHGTSWRSEQWVNTGLTVTR